MADFQNNMLTIVLVILGILLLLCLIKAAIGPRITDRIVCINMMGTIVIIVIAILTIMLNEGYLADICILYATISFLAVVVLNKLLAGIYIKKRAKAMEESNECD